MFSLLWGRRQIIFILKRLDVKALAITSFSQINAGASTDTFFERSHVLSNGRLSLEIWLIIVYDLRVLWQEEGGDFFELNVFFDRSDVLVLNQNLHLLVVWITSVTVRFFVESGLAGFKVFLLRSVQDKRGPIVQIPKFDIRLILTRPMCTANFLTIVAAVFVIVVGVRIVPRIATTERHLHFRTTLEGSKFLWLEIAVFIIFSCHVKGCGSLIFTRVLILFQAEGVNSI